MMEKLEQKVEDMVIELKKNTQKELKEIIERARSQVKGEVAKIEKVSEGVENTKQEIEGELQEVEKIRKDFREEVKKANEARLQVEGGAIEIDGIVKNMYSTIDDLGAKLRDIKNRSSMNEGGLQNEQEVSKSMKETIGEVSLIDRFRSWQSNCEIFWFGLAVFLFVTAFLFIQVVIFEGLQDKADIIILDGDITAGPIICANIKDVICKPIDGDLFEENHRMVCNFKIAPPEQGILANSTHLNTTICPHIAIKHGIWYGSEKKNVRGHHTLIKKCEGDSEVSYIIPDYGDYWAFPLLESSGYTNIEFQLICYNKSNEQIVKTFENNLNKFIRTASKVRVEIHTKTNSEADEKRSNRNYRFILSLFAIFGIFPAVYYLRNLYRNN